jgi:hypothetical protein
VSEVKLSGGCLCGAIRYQATSSPSWAGHCHCTLCRRSSGAPYMSWFVVPTAAFACIRGEPVLYASSDRARRGHCAICGTQLLFLSNRRPESTGITIASLDDANAVTPREHIFWDDRAPGLVGADELPKRAQRT